MHNQMQVHVAYFAALVTTMALAIWVLAAKVQTAGYEQPYRPQVHFSPRGACWRQKNMRSIDGLPTELLEEEVI
jgi:hypothetical protein